jgi:2-polyprenyl-3-methyl-5-hydroxy-6-metoxy-1,4-benzoquinol methylase
MIMDGGSCRFCGSVLQNIFLDLGMSPMANSYLKSYQLNQMEPFYPLRAYVCEHCFLVQLDEFESPDRIFSDYSYFSSYSEMFLRHAKTYVDMVVDRFNLSCQSYVVEIASNDGYLLKNFVARGIPVMGIEPAKNVAEVAIANGVATLIEFFGAKTAHDFATHGRQPDLIIGNNVLAHVPDLNDFVQGLKVLLGPKSVITMEFPHLMRLMVDNQFDTIYHEHFSYFSLTTVGKVFASHGLALFDVEEISTHGGSLRIYACHQEDRSKTGSERLAELRKREEDSGLLRSETYRSFSERVAETKRALLSFLIQAKRDRKSVVAYGAAAKASTMFNYCGIRSDVVDYIVDRSPHKQGHFVPGVHIPIYETEHIRQTRPDYVLIMPWNLRDEIMEQMAYVSEWGGRFVVPIPSVRVYP